MIQKVIFILIESFFSILDLVCKIDKDFKKTKNTTY